MAAPYTAWRPSQDDFDKMTAIANEIRAKLATQASLQGSEFAERIYSISTMGGLLPQVTVYAPAGALVVARQGVHEIAQVASPQDRAIIRVDNTGLWEFTVSMDGYEDDVFTVTVVTDYSVFLGAAPPARYAVYAAPTPNGTIVASKSSAIAGEEVTVDVYPETGYRLTNDSLKMNGQTIEGSFDMPNENASITANFEPIPLAITVAPMNHGAVTLEVDGALPGVPVVVTVVPDAGYQLAAGTLQQNGTVIENNSFIMPEVPVTITATFEPISYGIAIDVAH